MSMLSRLILSSAVMLSLAGTAVAADPVEERIKAFKGAKQSVSQIKDALGSGDTAALAGAARSLAALGERIPGLFPAGSLQGKTEASPDIWKNVPDFNAQAKNFQDRAQTLARMAEAGAGKAELADAFGKVAESCKACHRKYKLD